MTNDCRSKDLHSATHETLSMHYLTSVRFNLQVFIILFDVVECDNTSEMADVITNKRTCISVLARLASKQINIKILI